MPRTKQEITTFDKIQANLFGHDTKMVLSDKEQEIFLRYRAGFTAWLEDPTITDKQMATFLMNTFGIAKQTAPGGQHPECFKGVSPLYGDQDAQGSFPGGQA